ncbi:MAG: glycoside hydrolase family 16 protein [Bryobacteraceae bacterium]
MLTTLMYKLTFAVLITTLPLMPADNPKLAWSDEFNDHKGAPPDPSKWIFDLGGGGWGNHELEVYTRNLENVFQDGEGHLVIRAIKTDSGSFTSARIKTQGKYTLKYGKIEARMKEDVPSLVEG